MSAIALSVTAVDLCSMLVISIDVGAKNLAVCIVRSAPPSEKEKLNVIHWEKTCLSSKKSATTLDYTLALPGFVSSLLAFADPLIDSSVRFVVEQQLPRNLRMYTLAHALVACAKCLCPDIHVEFMSAQKKFKAIPERFHSSTPATASTTTTAMDITDGEYKKVSYKSMSYSARKRFAVEWTTKWVRAFGCSHTKHRWEIITQDNPRKKDDFADAFLQAVLCLWQ